MCLISKGKGRRKEREEKVKGRALIFFFKEISRYFSKIQALEEKGGKRKEREIKRMKMKGMEVNGGRGDKNKVDY